MTQAKGMDQGMSQNMDMRARWSYLHSMTRFRPAYPSEEVVQFIFRNFRRDGTERALDLGCGAGRHLFFMAKSQMLAYGMDISDEGISYIRRVAETEGLMIPTIRGEIQDLPFENDFFDAILCYGVLYYCKMQEIEQSFREMWRVMKKGAQALVVVRTTSDYRYGKGLPVGKNTFIVYEENQEKSSFYENGMQMHFFEKEEIEKLAETFSGCVIELKEHTHGNMQFKDSNFLVYLTK